MGRSFASPALNLVYFQSALDHEHDDQGQGCCTSRRLPICTHPHDPTFTAKGQRKQTSSTTAPRAPRAPRATESTKIARCSYPKERNSNAKPPKTPRSAGSMINMAEVVLHNLRSTTARAWYSPHSIRLLLARLLGIHLIR